MSRFRHVKGLVLCLAVVTMAVLGGWTTSGCRTSTQVIVEPDPRLFTLFAGLTAVGYGEGQADPSSERLRAQLKEALADWAPADLQPMTWLAQDYRPDQLVAATLQLGLPPDFASGGEQPPSGLQGFLVTLWRDVESLYKSDSEARADELKALAGPAEAATQGAIDYAGGRDPFRLWRVVPETLALPACAYGYGDATTHTAWVVVGSAPTCRDRDLVRETFRIVIHDELAQLEEDGALACFESVLERARFVPAVREGYPEVMPVPGMPGYVEENVDALLEYVEENLVLAATARAVGAGSPDAALNGASEAGFVLAPTLYEALAGYERSDQSLPDYLGTLLAAADVEAAIALAPLSGWEKVALPWWEGKTVEAWRFSSSVPGELLVELIGESSQGPPMEGHETQGWGSDSGGRWFIAVPRGEAQRRDDWMGVILPAGCPLWAYTGLTTPESAPDWEFVPDTGG